MASMNTRMNRANDQLRLSAGTSSNHSTTIGRFLTFGLLSLALILAVSSAPGAVIYTQGKINGESDVLNTGTLVLATDLGNAAPAVVVNGVAFGPDSSAGLSGWAHGNGDFSNQFPSGSPLDRLLTDLDFQNLFNGSATLTLSGLTPSGHYLLQMLLSNVVNTTGKTSRVTIQGQAYNIANFNNDADYIRADFFASASTEIVQFGNGSTVESDRAVLNAFALSQVPEPSALGLLSLGLAGFVLFRRTTRN